MRYLFILVILCFGGTGRSTAQESRPADWMHLDSLLTLTRSLTSDRQFDHALSLLQAAELFTIETWGERSAAYGRWSFTKGRFHHFQRETDEAMTWYSLARDILEEAHQQTHPDYASVLHNTAAVYMQRGEHAQAEPLFLEAMAIRERIYPKAHPDYLQSLNDLANLYMDMGKYASSAHLYLEAIELHKQSQQEESTAYASTLGNLAMLYLRTGEYQKAEPLLLEAQRIRSAVLGVEHPHYINGLNTQANLYRRLGRFPEAEKSYIEALATLEKTRGRDQLDYANSLANLGVLYHETGRYDQAIRAYQETKITYEKHLGKTHDFYARILNNLAILHRDMGQYEAAEHLYIESIGIRQQTKGSAHPDYATALNNLAVLYYSKGEYEKAEPLLFDVKRIWAVTPGEAHPNYASCLLNMANMYKATGRFAEAETHYLEVRHIREKSLGPEHPDYAASLISLAILYKDFQRYADAEKLYLDALQIRKMALGTEHPDYAQSLHNLANLYIKTGRLDEAEDMYTTALHIREKALGSSHPDYGQSLHNLANLYRKTGLYEKAESHYRTARDIRDQALGPKHPRQAEHLMDFAEFYLHTQRQPEATSLLQEAASVHMQQLRTAVSFLSEFELGKYILRFERIGERLLSYLQSLPSHTRETQDNQLPALIYDHMLFQKGYLLHAASNLRMEAGRSLDVQEKYDQLRSVHRRLAAEYSRPLDKQKQVEELEVKANTLEKELARAIYGHADFTQPVRWQEIRDKLLPHEAALEFVHFRVSYPTPSDRIQYAALLLKAGSDQPLFIPLCEEDQLNALLSPEKGRKETWIRELYASAPKASIDQDPNNTGLYELIWVKIEAAGLNDILTLYYAPSGILHLIQHGAIVDQQGSCLSDKYQIVRLGSTRTLAYRAAYSSEKLDAVIFADVDFGNASSESATLLDATLSHRTLDALRAESTQRHQPWEPLPWTEKEGNRIQEQLRQHHYSVRLFKGQDATEAQLKAIRSEGPTSPRLLHLATHGFFFPDPQRAFPADMPIDETATAFKWSDNPLIRSGLIMAGGNHAWLHGVGKDPSGEDGVLTAYEISQMDLRHTELVVLSACDTGLGDIIGNEGVYGLQRAFKIAGARYLLMSLWQVPDYQTMVFMTAFYQSWLEEGLSIPAAFHATQRKLRSLVGDVHAWGAFVLVE
jgi:tetratricopeptide (TPR) repeat protein/CHAT domain-containing protein